MPAEIEKDEFEWPDLSTYHGSNSRRVVREIKEENRSGQLTVLAMVLIGCAVMGLLLSAGLIKF